jgi:tetratricopeptide (TPR) repeat protein
MEGEFMRTTVALAAVLTLASGALAQSNPDVDFCTGTSGTADQRIAACTRAITSGRLSTETLAITLHNRGVELHGKHEYDRAIADYNEALRLNPRAALIYYNRGNAWRDKRDYDRAIADYNEALRLNPRDDDAYVGRGVAWHDKRDYDRAIADYSEALRLNPRYALAYNRRGNAWRDKRDYDRAIADYNELLRLEPNHGGRHNDVAWMLATSTHDAMRNGKRAIELARRACELTGWKDAGAIDTLAAAYAEAGQFAEAVRWQEKALADANFAKNAKARERLALYRAGKPYRE